MWVDNISIDIIAPNISISNDTAYEILRGSGEVHVSTLYSQLNVTIANIPFSVWNYTVRNLTFYPTQLDLTNYTNISESVWNYSTRILTFYPVQVDLTNYSLVNDGVWNYTARYVHGVLI